MKITIEAKRKTALRADGDLGRFDRQGWAHFIDLDDTHTAMGSYHSDQGDFYWILVGSSDKMPTIF